MNEHLERFKRLLDVAIKAGLFQKSEEVIMMHQSFEAIATMVQSKEAARDPRGPMTESKEHQMKRDVNPDAMPTGSTKKNELSD